METILDRENMMAAYARVVANQVAPGVDGLTVGDLKPFLVEHWPRIKEDLLAGRYRPSSVRGVDIPKPGGGTRTRTLDIPTVLDRLIQQAMHEALSPLFDPGFSASSFGLASAVGRAIFFRLMPSATASMGQKPKVILGVGIARRVAKGRAKLRCESRTPG